MEAYLSPKWKVIKADPDQATLGESEPKRQASSSAGPLPQKAKVEELAEDTEERERLDWLNHMYSGTPAERATKFTQFAEEMPKADRDWYGDNISDAAANLEAYLSPKWKI